MSSGGFIVDSSLGWRWTAWITMIPATFFGTIAFLTLPETYHPVLLQRRASRLRNETRIWAYHSRLDESTPTFSQILTKYLFRPLQMLFSEPILVCIPDRFCGLAFPEHPSGDPTGLPPRHHCNAPVVCS